MACSTSTAARAARPQFRRRTLIAVALGSAILGCPPGGNTDANGNGGGDDPSPTDSGEWTRPPVDATWHWQLQPNADGAINTSYAVTLYDIDLFDTPDAVIDDLHADGRLVIAYFSAGTYEAFRDDAGEFSAAELGEPLDDFPDERWLDIRSANVRRVLAARLDLAAARGFDGVEPDNVDGYANTSGFDLSGEDQLAFNRWLAGEAHARGLAVGLKNDLDQIPQLVEHFDFAVNEQCHEYDECDALRPFLDAGKPVFNAEYADEYVNNASSRSSLCQDALGRGIRTLVLPLDLDDSFRLSCDP